MAIDLENSYDDAKSRLKAYKEFTEVKSAIKNAQKKAENFTQPNFDFSKFQLDQAEINQQIKKKVEGQFGKLINLIQSNKGAGPDTAQFLIKKLVRAIRVMKPQLQNILVEEIIKALGCDLEQVYSSGSFYVRVQSFDLLKLLMKPIDSKTGKVMYEPNDFNDATSNNIPRSSNQMFRKLIESSQPLSSEFLNPYKGLSSNDLFDLQYFDVNPITNEPGGWFKVTLYDRPNGVNKISEFIVDYYQTINLFDFKALITQLLDSIFGIVSIEIGYGIATIDDKNKFGLLVQRILGLCFDEESEISVGGQSKTPELDDTNDSFFDITNIDTSIIEEKTSQVKRGIITFETCDNVELPINTESLFENISFVSDDGSNLEDVLNNTSTTLSNLPEWQLQFPYPNQIKITIDTDFIKNLPLALISTILSPKVLFPFLVMIKALGVLYDETITGITNFIKQNKEFMKQLISRIGALFIEILFNEIKKDIRNLVRSIIIDITKDEEGTVYLMIERLVNLAKTIIALVDDYRKCKSVIDAILQLFNLIPKLNPQIIPFPLLQLSSLLPGYSPNRAFINGIENMQKSGLPTGPNPDGTPNLGLMAMFAQMKGQDKEQKINGKLEGGIQLPPPFSAVKIYGKQV